jgi:hypothetical protein
VSRSIPSGTIWRVARRPRVKAAMVVHRRCPPRWHATSVDLRFSNGTKMHGGKSERMRHNLGPRVGDFDRAGRGPDFVMVAFKCKASRRCRVRPIDGLAEKARRRLKRSARVGLHAGHRTRVLGLLNFHCPSAGHHVAFRNVYTT